MKKRIGIVGAGVSGLAAIKGCLEEDLLPVCYERTGDIGGLWNFTEEVREGQGSVSNTTVTILSKEFMCYSDFPMPKSFPNFLRYDKFNEYLHLYTENFDLRRHIKFHNDVVSIRKADDFLTSGKWDIKIRDSIKGSETTESFDGVLVCAGTYSNPNTADFPGLKDFEGKIVHTHQIRSTSGFEGKRLVIIGCGNSGGDAAVNLSRVTSQVYLSTRGIWVLHRLMDKGMPFDIAWMTRAKAFRKKLLPFNYSSRLDEAYSNKWFDHDSYGFLPKDRINTVERVVSSDLPHRIICGDIIVHGPVKQITKHGVLFQDDGIVDDIDIIVMATGYKIHYPFVGDDIVKIRGNKGNLYKYCFPPDLEHHTLAFIGFLQPIGPCPAMFELQCRWVTRVLKGKLVLPDRKLMWEDIQTKTTAMRKRYKNTERYTLRVDYASYSDEIASLIGCKPHLGRMMLTDPVLAWKCFYGPLLPSQYRLVGPGKWHGAKDTILKVWTRVLPINKNGFQIYEEQESNVVWIYIIILIFAFFLIFTYFM